ncbi:hypothetical protein L3X38_037296 [Prunus dulcis]|uniref:Disease resistance family protein / LRR family protein n=1 Tax=Prunus dulcis TaxID=3755 RepID=A0AAD4YQJ3_PRUDU|nr:hypothetical protein L3X38_037296 [Prunus dulcis]
MNYFGGVFPCFIGSLEKLKYLNLSGLSFVRVIPPNLGNLSRLLYPDLSVGNLETDLQWLATLSSLKYLNLGGMNLTKTTSYWLPTVNMLPSLVELYLHSCSLPMLPLTLASINFTSLSVLDLSGNKFTSTIPPCLRYLELWDNSLQGSIPKLIRNLTSLEEFNLEWNQISGIIPESLRELSSLVSLHIFGNAWEGPIPHHIGQVMPNLIYLDISMNSLSGSILQFLGLSSNNFSGEVPSLKNCRNLRILDLGDNKFSGPILASIRESMPNLYILSLRFELVSKGRVFVHDYGSILYLVTSVDLSDNKLSGEIPMGLTSLIKLGTLNLSMNHLTRNIPANIGNLESIETLDISLNKLSGSIPQSMVNLTFLNHLNLSHNNLSGKIPMSNQFKTFVDLSIYEGNPGLSSCPLPIVCQDNEGAPQVPSGDGGEDDDSKLEKL